VSDLALNPLYQAYAAARGMILTGASKRIPTASAASQARAMGMWDGKNPAVASDAQLALLLDLGVFAPLGGHSPALEREARINPPPPGSEGEAVLAALHHTRITLFRVAGLHPDGGVWVDDLLRGMQVHLWDAGLARPGQEGTGFGGRLMPLDGFEMYNLHRSSLQNIGIAAELVFGKVEMGDFDGLPHPDAFFTAFTLDDPTYFATWGTVLARGVKRVTTMGTDCHRNTFRQKLQDGERIDSYRRMMSMFSNHLLVRPNADGSFDDRSLKEALRARRLYGTFEFLGTPVGFDFFAAEGAVTKEIGETTQISAGTVLEVKKPRVRDLDPSAPAPTITTKLWVAKEGGWDEVASTTEPTLRFTPTTPGVYRAEVRIVPTHLRPFIGKRNDFIRNERPWVMSNAIWVAP